MIYCLIILLPGLTKSDLGSKLPPLSKKCVQKKIRNAEPKISLGTAFASVSVCVSREQHLGIELKTTPEPTALQTSVTWNINSGAPLS